LKKYKSGGLNKKVHHFTFLIGNKVVYLQQKNKNKQKKKGKRQ